MNRKDRRRLQKSGKTVKPEPVLQLKPQAIDQMVKTGIDRNITAAKQQAKQEALAAINQQILERDEEYSLDIDTMILWTLHAHYGWGKTRLEKFYECLMNEHTRMREFYQIQDLYPERAKLKAVGVDVEELNRKYLDACKNTNPQKEGDGE